MDALVIVNSISIVFALAVSCTTLISFFRNNKKNIEKNVEKDVKESTSYAVNQQYMLGDLKEIKAQLVLISQKNETNFQMAVRQEERQKQTEKRLDNLEAKMEQVYSLMNKQGA